MIEVGPPPKQPLPSGGAAAQPAARPAAGAIPVQLLQPAMLPESLPANRPVPALVEPGGQAGILGDVVQLSTDQGPLTIQSPVLLAAGTRVTLQLAIIAGRAQLFLIPPRAASETRGAAGKPALTLAKPTLDNLLPGRAVIATVVRAAPRGPELPPQAAAPAAGSASGESAEAASELPATAPEIPAAEPAAANPAAPRAAPAVASAPTPVAEESPAPAAPAAEPHEPPAASPLVAARPALAQPLAGMAAGQQVTLTILAVNAKPAAIAPQAEPAPQAAPQAGAAAPLGNAAPLTTSTALPTVTPDTPASAAPAAPAIEAPAAAAAIAEPAAANAPAAPAQAAPAPPQAAATEAAPAMALPSAAPAAASPSSVSVPGDAIAIAASVVGSDAAGQPIVEAGPVLLVLQAKAPPVGSDILLALPRAAAEHAAAPSAPQLFAPLEEVVRAAANGGGALQQAVEALLPRPGPALAAQLALYLGGLRQGSVSSWLGKQASDELAKIGKGRAAQRLAAAFGEAAQASRGAERAGGWLSLTLPLVEAGLIQPVQLYVQRRRDEEEKSPDKPEAEQGRRFLIDFTLTRLGGIQLDGLARTGKLDLILRSMAPIEAALRGELDRLFANVTSARGLAGTLIFQVAPPVTPIPRPLLQQPAGGIIV